jgi:hypothetical protein
MDILLSILIPSVFERRELAARLTAGLQAQAGDLPVEILILTDNRRRRLGKKREVLIGAAQGRYLCHLDDDDEVSADFVAKVLQAITENPGVDVITYRQRTVEEPTGASFIVTPGLTLENQPVSKDEQDRWRDITRKPWHWCTWRTELARQAGCQDGNIDEDWHWVQQLLPLVKTEVHIPEVLHTYTWHTKTGSLCQTN